MTKIVNNIGTLFAYSPFAVFSAFMRAVAAVFKARFVTEVLRAVLCLDMAEIETGKRSDSFIFNTAVYFQLKLLFAPEKTLITERSDFLFIPSPL